MAVATFLNFEVGTGLLHELGNSCPSWSTSMIARLSLCELSGFDANAPNLWPRTTGQHAMAMLENLRPMQGAA